MTACKPARSDRSVRYRLELNPIAYILVHRLVNFMFGWHELLSSKFHSDRSTSNKRKGWTILQEKWAWDPIREKKISNLPPPITMSHHATFTRHHFLVLILCSKKLDNMHQHTLRFPANCGMRVDHYLLCCSNSAPLCGTHGLYKLRQENTYTSMTNLKSLS